MGTRFGQLVIGPPGSGKTTYCKGVAEFLRGIGRNVVIVNLDPANDVLPYEAGVDLKTLVALEDVMTAFSLGPNGSLIYCIEYLEKNLDWLLEQMDLFANHYFLIDCPGQVELYTHHQSMRNITEKLTKQDYRLCAVHLVDSYYCSDPGKFVSVLLTSLSTMLQMELPHINVLSKIDIADKFGHLNFGLDFYTEILDLDHLLEVLDRDPVMKKYAKLNAALVSLVEGYSLVSFHPLNISDKKSVSKVISAVDKANGYVFGTGESRNIQALLSCAVGAESESERLGDVIERYGQV